MVGILDFVVDCLLGESSFVYVNSMNCMVSCLLGVVAGCFGVVVL